MNENLLYTGQALTERFEGCSLTAYPDVVGVWTIGYGHTGGVTRGMSCTQAQADAWLTEDIQWAVSVVQNQVLVPLTQGQFNALVDFVFNVGGSAFARSTLLAKLNTGDYAGAAGQFQAWVFAGGKVSQGLLNRRIAEQEAFNE